MGLEKRRWWPAAGAAIAALLALAVVHHYSHEPVLKMGDRLQSLPVSSLNGSALDARSNGHPQIINIFASWCPPCREETPQIIALANDLKVRGITVIGVDQQEPAQAVQRFADSFGIPYPVYVDSTNITHDRLGARIIPTTIFVDGNGVIRWERSGPLTGADLRSLRSALAVAHS